jgi:hypothetical protein
MISVYSTLQPEHKGYLPNANALQKLTTETQQFFLEELLQSQFIGPSSVIRKTRIGEATTAWVVEKLKGLRIPQYRFVVCGPEQSGRSTLLSILVSVFFQKLQLAGESGNYLIVPFNFLFHRLYLGDYEKFYEIVVSTTLEALRVTRLDTIPIIDLLRQYFLSLLTVSTCPALILPACKHGEPSWASAVSEIAREIYQYWNRKDKSWASAPGPRPYPREDDNFRRFLSATVSFPAHIATAFGFKSTILVCDHLDVAGIDITPQEPFPVARAPVNLFATILEAIGSAPFFVSAHDEDTLVGLFATFHVQDYIRVTTEGIVDGPEPGLLLVPNTSLALEPQMCRGCPAYCAAFERVCTLAEEAAKAAVITVKYPRLKSVVDIARGEMVRQEFSHLASLLAVLDTDGKFDDEEMNEIMASEDFSVVVK